MFTVFLSPSRTGRSPWTSQCQTSRRFGGLDALDHGVHEALGYKEEIGDVTGWGMVRLVVEI